jgi:hypothetical protein
MPRYKKRKVINVFNMVENTIRYRIMLFATDLHPQERDSLEVQLASLLRFHAEQTADGYMTTCGKMSGP